MVLRQRRLEAREMRSAIHRVDVVGEGEDGLGVSVVVLQRNLHGYAITLGLHVDRLLVQNLLASVDVLDELGDTAGVLELLVLALTGLGIGGALVGQVNLQALVQERELAQPLRQGVVVEFGYGKDRLVGEKVDLGAFALAWAHLPQLAGRRAFAIVLFPGKLVAPDLDIELFAQRVHAAYTDAM